MCNEQEKREFIQKRRKIDYEIEEEKRKKYDVNNIFQKENIITEEKQLVVVEEKTNLFRKIISFIKKILK